MCREEGNYHQIAARMYSHPQKLFLVREPRAVFLMKSTQKGGIHSMVSVLVGIWVVSREMYPSIVLPTILLPTILLPSILLPSILLECTEKKLTGFTDTTVSVVDCTGGE